MYPDFLEIMDQGKPFIKIEYTKDMRFRFGEENVLDNWENMKYTDEMTFEDLLKLIANQKRFLDDARKELNQEWEKKFKELEKKHNIKLDFKEVGYSPESTEREPKGFMKMFKKKEGDESSEKTDDASTTQIMDSSKPKSNEEAVNELAKDSD